MMKTGTLLLITAIGASLLWSTAAAQAQTMRCFPLDALERVLERGGEQLAVEGEVRGREHKFRLYINPETGDWTAVLVRADGPGCPMIAGPNLQPVEAEPPQLDAKSPGGNNERERSSDRDSSLSEDAP